MRNWSARNKFLFNTTSALVIGGIITVTVTLATQTTSSDTNQSLCPTMTDNLSNTNSLQFHPLKIVAEPWRGEHHVYAIFAVPLQYKNISHRSQLLVKGTEKLLEVTPANERLYGLTVPEGYFLLVGYFYTRLALWYWVSGRFSDLQQPCNWTLYVFPDNKKN